MSLSVYKLVARLGQISKFINTFSSFSSLASVILKMNLLETKVVTLVILAVVSFLIGLSTIPLRFEVRKVNIQNVDVIFSKRVLGGNVGTRRTFLTSFLLCFGGGVLLATTMIHLLPEISHNLEDSAERLELEFLPELVVCAGFFLIYLVEELAELVMGGQEKSVRRDSECCHSDLERHLGARTSHSTTHNYGSIGDQTELLNTDQTDSETLPAQTSTALREFFTSNIFLVK